MNNQVERTILEKLKGLRPERIAEVEDFVDFLKARDEERGLTQAAGALADAALRKVWDNADDADYDRL
ncbi:MAG: toxin-antitoxin system, antitoxin component, Xre family protein [Bryobacteraceae bacterium]